MSVLGVELETADVKALRDFYVNRLKFTLLEETASQLKLQVGYTRLVFSQAASGAQPRYRFSVGILAQRFTDVAEGLGRRIALIAQQGQTLFNYPARKVQAIYTSDPAGNTIEFAGYSSTSADGRLLGLTAVGMAVTDVEAIARYLQDQLEFRATPINADGGAFVLVNDACAFVLAKPGAPWLPSSQAAGIHPLLMTIRGKIISETKILEYPYYVYRYNK